MRKVRYFILGACASWLLLYQIVVGFIYAADKVYHHKTVSGDEAEWLWLDTLVSVLTVIVSVYTLRTSIAQIKNVAK